MTAPDQPQAEAQPTEAQAESAPNPNAELRATLDRRTEERDSLRSRVLGGEIRNLGLDPEKGLGKAIAKGYEGDYSPESIATYAKDEWDHQIPEAAPSEQETPELKELEGKQAVADQAVSVSESREPESNMDRVAAAEAALLDPKSSQQDVMASLNTKLDVIRSQ